MNIGFPGEGFPYTNFHDMNLDWMIKIAKDFLDQYTHIQEIIEQGKTDIINLTESGLDQLQEKADALEELLQAWYTEHSEDIANQLAAALDDLNEWYTTHEGYLDQYVTDSIAAFNAAADLKAANTIATIPDDYTALFNFATNLKAAMILETHVRNSAEADGFGYFDIPMTITNSNLYTETGNGTHVLVPVNPGDSVTIKANSTNAAIYAVLRSYDPPVAVQAPDFSQAVGFTERAVLAAGTSVTLTMPDDAACIYFTKALSGNTYTPSSVIINGYEVIAGIRKTINNVIAGLSKYTKFVGSVSGSDNIDSDLTTQGYYTISANTMPSGDMPDFDSTFYRYLFNGVSTSGLPNIQFLYSTHSYTWAYRFKAGGSWQQWQYSYDMHPLKPFGFNYHSYPTVDINTNPLPVNAGEEIRVLTYNIGRYNMGTATPGFPASVFNEKLRNLRRFIFHCDADILFLQEDTSTLSQSDTYPPHNYAYAPMYMRLISSGGCSVYTRTEFIAKGSRSIGNGRSMVWALTTIKNKKVLCISAHASFDTSEHKEEEYNSIFNWINTYWNAPDSPDNRKYDVCIIAGDMNSSEAEDRALLAQLCSDNQFYIGNGGFLGWLNTTPDGLPIDNIMVKNGVFTDLDVKFDWYSSLYSDHYPVFAKLMMKS